MPTPFYADKSWWLVAGTIISVLFARYLKLELSAADIAGLAAAVGAYVFASKSKQAREIEAQMKLLSPEDRKKLHDELEAMDKKPSAPVPPAVVGALLIFCLLGSTGCVTIKRIGKTTELAAPAVLDCVGDVCKEALPDLLVLVAAELGKVVAGGSFDVEPVIDRLLQEKGPFAACAIAEVLKAWEQAGGGAGMPAPVNLENRRLLFVASHVGQTHLLARGYMLK